ncbi:hypothetical protein BC826DRAFT_480990 [Russula brevipes]|nr:hypothetical protein BC826DRAFT_480990 [Russula brevipes]
MSSPSCRTPLISPLQLLSHANPLGHRPQAQAAFSCSLGTPKHPSYHLLVPYLHLISIVSKKRHPPLGQSESKAASHPLPPKPTQTYDQSQYGQWPRYHFQVWDEALGQISPLLASSVSDSFPYPSSSSSLAKAGSASRRNARLGERPGGW